MRRPLKCAHSSPADAHVLLVRYAQPSSFAPLRRPLHARTGRPAVVPHTSHGRRSVKPSLLLWRAYTCAGRWRIPLLLARPTSLNPARRPARPCSAPTLHLDLLAAFRGPTRRVHLLQDRTRTRSLAASPLFSISHPLVAGDPLLRCSRCLFALPPLSPPFATHPPRPPRSRLDVVPLDLLRPPLLTLPWSKR